MTVGDIVKQYRESHQMSMDEFSKKSGLSKGYISMLENKVNPRNNKVIVPTLTTLQKIARCMNIDVDDLLAALDRNQEVSISSSTAQLQDDEFLLLADYRLLNDVGKFEARKRVNELTCFPKYQSGATDDYLRIQAAHERTDIKVTDEMRKHDHDIMNNDEFWK